MRSQPLLTGFLLLALALGSLEAKAQLSGNYTINPLLPPSSGNFQDFNAALDSLEAHGVSGAVTFNAASGTYAEQLNFPAIRGISATNTITFQSQAAHADSVKLQFSATSSSNNFVVNLDTLSYISFLNLSMTALSNDYYTVLTFKGIASYNTLKGCKIIAQTVPSSTVPTGTDGMVQGTALTGRGNLFFANRFTAGMRAIALSGQGASARIGQVTIDSNAFVNNFVSAVYLNNIRNLALSKNTISANQSHEQYVAIDMFRSDSIVSIIENKITINGSSGKAFSLSECNGLSARPILVANNSIAIRASNDITAISISQGLLQDYFHNSVNMTAILGTGSAVGIEHASNGSGFRIKNNVFACNAVNGALVLFLAFIPGAIDMDYNNYYTTSGTVMAAPPAFYPTLASWRSASGIDMNSVSAVPLFTDSVNLRPLNACLKGTSLTAVPADIEGVTRGTPPVLGAYETPAPATDVLAVAELIQPVKPFTPGVHDVKVRIHNMSNASVAFYEAAMVLNGATPVVVQRSGGLAVCESDTVTFVTVNMPGASDLVIYTSDPADNERNNDTLKVLLKTAMSGLYTIGGTSPSFATFTAAAANLKELGISGRVTFDVAAGTTFNEPPVVLDNIAGSGTNGAIIFRKSGAGANPVLNGQNGTGSRDAVITVFTTDSVTFDGIDVRDHSSNSNATTRMEYGYHITTSSTNGSTCNTIKNCRVTLNRANNPSIGVYQSAINNHNNRYENIRIENAGNGFLLEGDVNSPDSNCVITSSGLDTTIVGGTAANDIGGGATSVGIRLTNQRNVEVSNCVVRNITVASGSAIGIFLSNANVTNSSNAVIKNNLVHRLRNNSNSTSTASNQTGGGVFGIRVDVSPSNTATVFNNVVHSLYKTNSASANATVLLRGITHCFLGGGSASYFNNSVHVTSGTSLFVTSAAFHRVNGSPELRNNILINTTGTQSGNAKHYAIYNNFHLASSNNLLWVNNALSTNGFTGFSGSDRRTMYDWRNATSQDLNSVFYFPALDTSNHLLPNPADTTVWALNGRGLHLDSTFINADISGKARPLNVKSGVPDIGAYEVSPTSLPPLATAVPASISPLQPVDTTQVFIFAEDTVVSIKWGAGSDIPKLAVRQFSGTMPQQVSANQNYMHFYTDINAVGTGPYNYQANIYYHDNWIGTNPEENDLRLTKRDGSLPWSLPSGSVLTTDAVRNILSATALSGFSQFSGTDLYNPMPVKLLSFTGDRSGNDVELSWITASEMNNKGFEVQRSIDGKHFEQIGFVKGNGTSNNMSRYALTDADAFAGRAKTLYYRLKQVDHNNTFAYSNIVIVNSNQAAEISTATVYPNPFHNQVFVSISQTAETTAQLDVFDITGKRVLNESLALSKGNNLVAVSNAHALNSGIYFVKLSANGHTQTFKLMKQ